LDATGLSQQEVLEDEPVFASDKKLTANATRQFVNLVFGKEAGGRRAALGLIPVAERTYRRQIVVRPTSSSIRWAMIPAP
jgi:hypothetical protein